ncbi:MAG: hypothetical protein G01um101429_396 [Parcubacteria group bacterium Gr01-1014_29]|nr:MAG: hypothetical protein G01um101429_396 [Parcubacteria group bacterium Gr01-1014_29]
MSYWRQKEYPFGELYRAFQDVGVILGEEIFNCSELGLHDEEKGSDELILRVLLKRLSGATVSLPDNHGGKLTVESGQFRWKHGVGKDEMYCMCRMVPTGWLFEVGGSDDFGIAVNFGWRRLSYEHPLSGTTITAGPSRHLGLCRNY